MEFEGIVERAREIRRLYEAAERDAMDQLARELGT